MSDHETTDPDLTDEAARRPGRRPPDLERRGAAASGGDAAATGRDGGLEPARGVGRYSWMFLVAAIVALALGSWTLLVAIVGLALLIFVHELGHFLAAKGFRMRVERFYIGFPPAALRRTRGETEYGVGTIPLGGFCKISGMTPEEEIPDEVVPRAYYTQPVWKRNITIFAGPLANFVAAAVILLGFYLLVGVASPSLTVDVVRSDTPAETIGLVEGDTLVSADGLTFKDWDHAAAYLQAHPDETIALTYETKGGERRTTDVTLSTFPDDESKGFLGVGPATEYDAQPPLEAARLAGRETYEIFRLTFVGLWMLVSGEIDVGGDEGAVGPVGIVAVSSDAAREGYYPLLLAFISVNLGIMNLLPFLPFDGGHIMINFAERIRGRRLSARLIEGMTAVGVTLLVAFFLYVTWNDVVRLLG